MVWVYFRCSDMAMYFKQKGHCPARTFPMNLLLGRQFITSSGKSGVVNERDSQIILVVSNDF